jgi:type 1 glutamine amidotransferase/sugar phosphate isomerase/epimerase
MKNSVNMMRLLLLITTIGSVAGFHPVLAQTSGRGGRAAVPSTSVRPPDQGKFRTTALTALGWRLGVRSDAFGPVTFWEAAAKADAAGLSAIEGVGTQKVSPDIARNLDYNLSADEIAKVRTRLEELRLRMPAYRLEAMPAEESERRKIFGFVKELGADLLITPAETSSFAGLDKLANEFAINVAVIAPKANEAMAALEGRSKRMGLNVDTGAWMSAGVKLLEGLAPLKDRVLSVSLGDRGSMGAKGPTVTLGAGVAPVSEFLTQLSRLQPPNIQPDWPPATDGGAKRSEVKPLFFSLEAANGKDAVADLSAAAAAYDKLVRSAIAWRMDTLSRMTTISSPDRLSGEVRKKIDAAIPRQALVKPKKARKLLVMDLCVNGGYYHATIPHGNLALELIGKYTGAYIPVFSNDLNNLRYPAIRQYDAVFLNSVEGELFIDPGVMNSLLRYVREGGGLAGLHATTFASTDVPEFGELIGAQSGAHKYNGEPGTLRVEEPGTPLTAHFPNKSFDFEDEFYHFLPTGPYSRDKLRILLSLDPTKTALSANQYTTRPDNDYGMVWIRSLGKGRVFNCALGHRPEFYQSPDMEKLILAATQFVLGDLAADTTPSAKLAQQR